MYNNLYYKKLSKKNSERSKQGWKIRRLRSEALAGEWDTYSEVCGRVTDDRKGKIFDVWRKTSGVQLEISHSMNRSDQYNIIIYEPKKWSSGYKSKKILDLSMPKVLNVWKRL